MAGARSSVPIARMSGAVASTLVQMLRRRAQEQPHQRAITFLADGESQELHLDYAALDLRARELAAHLQQAVGPGERALLVLPPGLDYVAALFGCFYAGVVAVPVYAPRRLERVASRLQALNRSAQATVLLAPGALLSEAAQAFAGFPELSSLRHLAVEEGAGAADGLVRARPGRREHRAAPVHVRLHRRPQGRRPHPRRAAAPSRADPRAVRAQPRGRVRELAPSVSRHGPDRRDPRAAPCRLPRDAALPRPFPAAARPLAGGPVTHAGDRQRRTQLRLRAAHGARGRGAARPVGPEPLARGLQRRRADPGRDAPPFRAGLRRKRLPERGLLPVLRAGGGDALRLGRLPQRRARDRNVLEAGPGRGTRGGGSAGRGASPGRVRRPLRRPARRDRRSSLPRAVRRRKRRRDLGLEPDARPRLLGPARRDERQLRGAPGGQRRQSLPAHRRPGLPARRPAVRDRPPQGPDHHPRTQPLPAGPRGQRGAQPSRAAAGRRRRLLRRRGRRGAPGDRARDRAPPARTSWSKSWRGRSSGCWPRSTS